MADSIGRIGGGNSYFGNGYVNLRNNQQQEEVEQQVAQHQYNQVDADDVMAFLGANGVNNIFAPQTTGTSTPKELDPATEERIGGYMERFEHLYGLLVEEFGEELAPDVMDVAMDKLMSMAK